MGIMTIGSRLVRAFGEGKNLRKVVTECVNGKTYTRVLDTQGHTLKNRFKMIERTNVGNKKVSTITKVNEYPDIGDGLIKKTTYNRVYNSEGALFGSRWKFEELVGNNFKKVAVSKQGTSYSRQLKYYDNGLLDSKHGAHSFPGSNHSQFFSSACVKYNKKGLPCPKGLSPNNDMSLKEMKDWHFANCPERPYAHPALNLGFLDERGVILSNLDKYI